MFLQLLVIQKNYTAHGKNYSLVDHRVKLI